ncbi:putative secreted protein [Aphis craccivora]|uniref:Putative secreted protein n=1 Tax=Aphis craccivora TaxID=307492 RepID=A0A6G0YGW0_APHCR|nr:putative secreted protein [Aphis craccivora]
MPTLNPVGHQSTNTMVRLVLMVAMAAFTSLGTTSPRYSMQQAMYLPCRGSHLTIWLAGSKHAFVISATDSCSWYAFSADMTGAYVASGKWMRGYGTRFVWNSVRSTFSAPSNRSDAVMDDTICPISRFRFVYVGRSMSRFRRQMS